MHEVLVYRLGGLSLPMSNVVINKISSCRVKRSLISCKGRKCVTVTLPVAKKVFALLRTCSLPECIRRYLSEYCRYKSMLLTQIFHSPPSCNG